MRIHDYFQPSNQSNISDSASNSGFKSLKSINTFNETTSGKSFKDLMLQTLGSRGSRAINQQQNISDRLKVNLPQKNLNYLPSNMQRVNQIIA